MQLVDEWKFEYFGNESKYNIFKQIRFLILIIWKIGDYTTGYFECRQTYACMKINRFKIIVNNIYLLILIIKMY